MNTDSPIVHELNIKINYLVSVRLLNLLLEYSVLAVKDRKAGQISSVYFIVKLFFSLQFTDSGLAEERRTAKICD